MKEFRQHNELTLNAGYRFTFFYNKGGKVYYKDLNGKKQIEELENLASIDREELFEITTKVLTTQGDN